MNQPLLETLKQARDALDHYDCLSNFSGNKAERVLPSIRAAIEQLEKAEPVAWMWKDEWGYSTIQSSVSKPNDSAIPLYTHPAAPGEKKMSKTEFIKANLKKGEIYAGIILGKDGQPDHHLILLPGKAQNLTWEKAKEWAKKSGGELPTRREQSLLFANLKEEFEAAWYWSGEEYSSEPAWAWSQFFYDGNQGITLKSNGLRARAVRRLIIEE